MRLTQPDPTDRGARELGENTTVQGVPERFGVDECVVQEAHGSARPNQPVDTAGCRSEGVLVHEPSIRVTDQVPKSLKEGNKVGSMN